MIEGKYRKSLESRGDSLGAANLVLEGEAETDSHNNQNELIAVVNGLIEFTIEESAFFADCDSETLILAKIGHSFKNIGQKLAVIFYGYKTISI